MPHTKVLELDCKISPNQFRPNYPLLIPESMEVHRDDIEQSYELSSKMELKSKSSKIQSIVYLIIWLFIYIWISSIGDINNLKVI
jgi:hypothetical protein